MQVSLSRDVMARWGMIRTRTSVLLTFCLFLAPFASTDAAAQTRPTGRLGIGFLWTVQSQELAGRLNSETDFIDTLLNEGKLDVFRQVKPPVRVACIAMSLQKQEGRPFRGLKETIEALRQANVLPDRVILAYNPERGPGTTTEEIDDLLGSIRQARKLADDYGAPLLVGPGLREMQQREDLYPELAKLCDYWLIQSQRLQLDPATRKPVEAGGYRRGVQQIVDALRQGNPKLKIIVQIVTTAERGRVVLTAEQIIAHIRAVEDIVDAVRLYGASRELLTQVIDEVRREPPAASLPASRPTSAPAKQELAVPMRDGATLATDLYLPPAASEPRATVPVVLICTPYDKSRESPIDRWREVLTRNGYAVAVQDIRGFYASRKAGRGVPRRYDGYDSIEWLAVQPWCSGKVGMMGYSHLGAAQYEAAVTSPPHLACAIPAQAPGNYYTDSFYPTVFRKADMETILRGRFTSRTAQLISRRIRSRERSEIEGFNVPMMHSAGWYDFYVEGAIEMFRACQTHGGRGAKGQQRLLIGPWGHGVLQEEVLGSPLRLPGGLAYPPNSKLDWAKDVWLPWFDHWLKAADSGLQKSPAVRYYLMGDCSDPRAPGNRWIEAEDYPPKSAPTTFYAHDDHALSEEPPPSDGKSVTYEFDPRDPVPTPGRIDARLPVKGPFDQRDVEQRGDVVVFTAAKLDTPLTIVGQVRAKLWASSDRTDTDFTVKLTDVYPDGRSMPFLDSVVKARYRNTYLKEEFLTPGQAYEFDIDLGHTAIVLAPGHRLRLAVSSSNFDRFDINPNTGEPYGDHAVTRALLEKRLEADKAAGEPQYSKTLIAKNTLFLDRSRPTRIILPLLPEGLGGR